MGFNKKSIMATLPPFAQRLWLNCYRLLFRDSLIRSPKRPFIT